MYKLTFLLKRELSKTMEEFSKNVEDKTDLIYPKIICHEKLSFISFEGDKIY